MIKLIALDLDGTLMSPDHLTVSNENRKALKMAHDKGIKIAISTGRTLAIIGDICEQVPEVDYIIYSNGAGVFDRKQNKNIYTNFMKWDICNELIDFLNEQKAFCEIYLNGKSYAQLDKGEYFIDDVLPREFTEAIMAQMIIVDDVKSETFGNDIEKITIYSKVKGVIDELWEHFSKMQDKFCIASSILGNMELTNVGVDKATAIDGMAKVLGFTADNVMAFGDAGNDCPMLEYAKYSFAMENATDECKQSAKFVTKSNAEDGVAWAINKYLSEQ